MRTSESPFCTQLCQWRLTVVRVFVCRRNQQSLIMNRIGYSRRRFRQLQKMLARPTVGCSSQETSGGAGQLGRSVWPV